MLTIEHFAIDITFDGAPQATFYSIVDRDMDERRYIDIEDERCIETWKKMRGFNWVIADGHELPFQNDVFGKVTSLVILPYAWNERTVLEEIHRTLKPHGKLLVSHRVLLFYIRKFLLRTKTLQDQIRRGTAGRLKDILFPILPSDLALKIFIFIFNDNRQPYFIRKRGRNLETFTTPKKFPHLLQQTGFAIVELRLLRRIAHMRNMPIIIQIKAKKKACNNRKNV